MRMERGGNTCGVVESVRSMTTIILNGDLLQMDNKGPPRLGRAWSLFQSEGVQQMAKSKMIHDPSLSPSLANLSAIFMIP